jgi:hypothetical protein
MAAFVSQALPWVAVVAMLLGAGAALALLTARSLFSACIALAALCACATGALLALGHADGAVALALVGVGITPVLLLAGVLLSSRAVKPRARGLPLLSIVAAICAAGAMLWAAPMLGLEQPVAGPRGGVSLALGALVFVAIAACVALLGYGERGVLGSRGGGER